METTYADSDADSAVASVNNPTNVTFEMKYITQYVPVVTLSAEDINKLLEQLKTGSKLLNWININQK